MNACLYIYDDDGCVWVHMFKEHESHKYDDDDVWMVMRKNMIV